METLVVLTALVCGAIAAPALQDQGFQEFKPTQDVIEDLTQREKKSPMGNHGFSEFSNAEPSTSHGFDLDAFPETARSLHFKKPLIVKKKVGYHLYRDSDEEKEQATSRESCKERVKVKLCDENILPKSSDLVRSTTIEDVGEHVMSEGEMKHSLKMAKEAIANLERDLEKIEQKPGAKISQRKHDDVDSKIHEDIDTARQVLEHIHKNFGDLEAMSIHTTTSKDADSMHNVHLTIAKTEEERMAQWKEAMKNIQKNAELARNIEDSFKSARHDLSLNDFQMTEAPKIGENIDTHSVFDEMRTENSEFIEKNKPKLCDSKLHDAKLAQNQGEDKEHSVDDMNGFASTIVESNIDMNSGNFLRNGNLGTTLDENTTTQVMIGPINKNKNQSHQTGSSDNVSDREEQIATELEQSHIISMKDMKNDSEKATDIDNTKMIITNGDALNSNPILLTSNTENTELDNIKNNADCMDKDGQKNISHETEQSEDIKTITKSATNIDTADIINTNINNKVEDRLQTEQRRPVDTTETVMSNQLLHQTRSNENDAMTDETQHAEHAVVKPFDNKETSHFQEEMRKNEQLISKSEITNKDQETLPTNMKPIDTEGNTGMKSADTANIPTQHTFNMRWSSDQMKNNKPTMLDKGSNDFPSDFHSRVPSMNTRFMNGPHMTSSMNSASNFDASSIHDRIHTSHVNSMHGHMTHGKSSDMDNIAQPNINMNMRDAMGNFGSENNVMRWKPSHESARTVYGPMAPAAVSGAGPSAVGLFPNANVGGCSIPLLLSCSPSVTSGSLAKALPAGYASPAYRSEDEFAFFPNKREAKKSKEILDTTVIKTSTKTKQIKSLDSKL